jgi:hypothetical protein
MRTSAALSLASALLVLGAGRAALAEEAKKSAVTFESEASSLEALLEKAKAERKPLFLDFYSPT